MESRLHALEESDEVAELSRIQQRLDKLHTTELSYAEQRAEDILSKGVHQELVMRLAEEQRELLLQQAKLASKSEVVDEARQQLEVAHALIKSLPKVLEVVSRQEQEGLVIALISRIDVNRNNEVEITLRLDPDVIHRLELPNLQSVSSHQPGLEPSDDSLSVELDNSTEQAHDQYRQKVTAARYTHNTGCMQC